MTAESPTDPQTKTPRRTRGWGRSLALAIAVHVILALVAWRIAVRVGLWPDQTPPGRAADRATARPQIPVIMPAAEAINATPARASLVAFAQAEQPVEWKFTPHERFRPDWAAENAPMIGYPRQTPEIPPRFKAPAR
jgi:hypothetical protein